MSIEPTCHFCGLVDKSRCRSQDEAEDCPHAPLSGKGPVIRTGPLAGLKRQYYGVIYADPPWAFKTFSEADRGVVPHRTEEAPYQPMTRDELLALPVSEIAAKDCILHLWVISSHVDQAFELAAQWGFTFKSLGMVWVKTQKGDPEVPKMGMGMWFRQEAEVCLLFTKGKPTRIGKGVRQTILEPAREHSRKPEAAYERIEALTAGPYVELFSRASRTGWDAMGNERGKFDVLDPIEAEEIESLI